MSGFSSLISELNLSRCFFLSSACSRLGCEIKISTVYSALSPLKMGCCSCLSRLKDLRHEGAFLIHLCGPCTREFSYQKAIVTLAKLPPMETSDTRQWKNRVRRLLMSNFFLTEFMDEFTCILKLCVLYLKALYN